MTLEKPIVVLLDDSEVCLELATDALESAGMQVVTGNSGLGASRLLAATRPDCVVIDVSMPALSGDRLVEIIRRSVVRDVPIVLHSDRPRGELAALAQTCGANGAVVKTPDCRQLVTEVRRLLRPHATRGAL
jgi:DNA-binding response OmpR family regulator